MRKCASWCQACIRASRVFVFDHTIRETGVKNLNAAVGGAAAPVPRVHCDYTHEGAPRRLAAWGKGDLSHLKKRDLTADEVDALEAGRYLVHQRLEKYRLKRPVAAESPLARLRRGDRSIQTRSSNMNCASRTARARPTRCATRRSTGGTGA